MSIPEQGTVLIIDDNVTNLQVLYTTLEQANFRVLVAQDGHSALERLTYSHPDIILLDIMMPGMDGFELFNRLKSHNSAFDIPVIFLSALSATETKLSAFKAGAVDYITKPFQAAEVVARVETHLTLCRLRRELELKNAQLEEEILARQQAEAADMATIHRLNTLIELVGEGVTLSDETGYFEVFNDKAVEITGYTKEDANTCPDFLSLLYPDPIEHDKAVAGISEIIATGDNRELETTIRTKAGQSKTLLVSTAQVIYQDREWFLSTYRDITERKQAEDKLRYQATLLNNISDAIISTDIDNFRIKSWNKVAEKIYGWPAEEVIGKTVEEVTQIEFPYESPEMVVTQFHEAGLWQGESIQYRKDGQPLYIHSSVSLVRDEAGNALGAVALNHDITARKQAEMALQEANERLNNILSSISDGFFTLNNQLVVTYFNQAAEQLLGLKQEDVLGRSLFDVFEVARGTIFEEKYRWAVQEKHPIAFETYFEPYQKWYDVRIYPYEDGIAVYFQVTTERKLAQDLLSIQHKLAHTLASMSNIGNIMAQILAVACQIEGVDAGSIYLVDPETESLTLVSHVGVSEAFVQAVRFFSPESPQTALVKAGQPIYSQYDNIASVMDEVRRAETLRAVAIVPVHFQDRIIASLNLASRTSDKFSDHTCRVMESIGSLIGGIIARVQAEEALRQSEQKYRLLADNSSDVIWTMDLDWNFTYISPSVRRLLGYQPAELLEMSLPTIMTPASLQIIDQARAERLKYRQNQKKYTKTRNMELEFIHKNGFTLWAEVVTTPLHDETDNLIGFLATTRDITERKRAEEALRESEELFRLLFQNMYVGVLLQDSQAKILLVNQLAADLLGVPEDDLVGATSFDPRWQVIHEDGRHFPPDNHPVPQAIASRQRVSNVTMGVWRPAHKDYVWLLVSAEPQLTPDGQINHVICSFSDITERKHSEDALQRANELLHRLATLDGLTQVANRRRFDAYLSQVWQMMLHLQAPLSLILGDIDYFKRYNDYYGHQQGDDCLRQVAQAINRVANRPEDLVARYGGEEFAVILPNVDYEEVYEVAHTIQRQIAYLEIDHQRSEVSPFVTLSLGVASLIPHPDLAVERLIELADKALYKAKRQGRNCVV